MPLATDAIWLDVLPNMSRLAPEMVKGTTAASTAAGAASGKSYGKALLAGVAVVAGGAVLATRALYNVGKTFDDVTNTIRAGTGAQGDALDGLIESAKKVGTRVPAEFDAIGTTVADLNTRLGLTGSELEAVASQILEAGRMLGTEVDVNQTAAAFKAFRLEAGEIEGAMDALFRASQATGVSMNELAAGVQKSAPALKELGFSFEDSIALMGSLDKAGLNANQMAGSLTRSISALAKEGEQPAEAFRRVVDEIEGFIAAGDSASAYGVANKVFGTRGATQFVDAIQSGVLEIDNLMAAAGASEDTIMGVAKETRQWSEEWRLLKNKAMVLVEPVAAKLFNTLNSGMKWINDTGVPALKDMAEWMKENKSTVSALGTVVGGLVAGLVAYTAATKAAAIITAVHKAGLVATTAASTGATASTWSLNAALRANPIGVVVTLLAALATGVVLAYRKFPEFKKVVDAAWVGIKKVLGAMWHYLTNVVIPVFKFLWNNVVKPIFRYMGAHIASVWNGVIKPVFRVLRAHLGHVGDVFGVVVGLIRKTWSKLGGIVQRPIDAAIKIINGFIRLVNKIPGVELPLILGSAESAPKGVATGAILRRATGGPVFGPGTGTSDSIPALLSNNEHVLTAQEVIKAGGHAAIERLRAAIRSGNLHIPAFSRGGRVVPGRGNRHTSGYPWASYAGDFPNPPGTPVRAWKDGVVKLVQTLAGSYGKHIRMNHDDGTSSLYAHLRSFAVRMGQRVGQGRKIGEVGSTGNSSGPHLHFETMGGPYKGGPGGSSIWDKVLGSVKGLGSWFSKRIKSALIDKVSVGGLFGTGGMKGMLGHIGGQIRDHVKGQVFDSGGWLMPGQAGINLSSRPEPIFSARQWDSIHQAIRPAMGKDASGVQSRPITVDGKSFALLVEDLATGAAYIAIDDYDAHQGQLSRMAR